jgi:hypothetical protein
MNDEFESALFEPVVILPSQISGNAPWASETSGPIGLMVAVLEEATRCIERGRRRHPAMRALAAEAEAWMRCDSRERPFAFGSICDVLGLDVDATRAQSPGRRGLRRSRETCTPSAHCRRTGTDDGRRRPRCVEGSMMACRSSTHSWRYAADVFLATVLSTGLVSVSHAALPAGGLGAACVGDCDDSGAVSVAELVKGVSIALGTRPLDQCLQVDCNETGRVTVDCLVHAVSAALNGCQSTPTSSPTQPIGTTDTPIPTATSTRPLSATETPTTTPTVATGPCGTFLG